MLVSRNDEAQITNSHLNSFLKSSHKNSTEDQSNKIKGIQSLKSSRERLLARFVNQIVASVFDIPAEQLLKFARGKADATRARQVSIYLMHTKLSFTFTQIAKIYGKDRTTIAHACRLIEDLRDSANFDHRLMEFELTISLVLNLSDAIVEDVVSNA